MVQVTEVPIVGAVRLTVRWDTSQFDAWADGFRARLNKPTGLRTPLGSIVRDKYRRNFEGGGNPAWVPLRPRTVAEKAKFLSGKPSPPFNKKGQIPKRLLQKGGFGATTILIRTGKLRDSYVQKGAEGNVDEMSQDGRTMTFGSQLTIPVEVPLKKPLKHYHLFTKKALKARAAGKAPAGTMGRIPLARFHEEGTVRMAARRNTDVYNEDLEAIGAAALTWVLQSVGAN